MKSSKRIRRRRQLSAISQIGIITIGEEPSRFARVMIVWLVAHSRWIQPRMEIIRAAIYSAPIQLNLASNPKETETLFTPTRNHGEAQAANKLQQFLDISVQLKRRTAPAKHIDEGKPTIFGMGTELSGAFVRSRQPDDRATILLGALGPQRCRSFGKAVKQFLK